MGDWEKAAALAIAEVEAALSMAATDVQGCCLGYVGPMWSINLTFALIPLHAHCLNVKLFCQG